jgi:HSP20 family molecular chaperone IbpA
MKNVSARYGVPFDMVCAYAVPMETNDWVIPGTIPSVPTFPNPQDDLQKAIEEAKKYYNEIQDNVGQKRLKHSYDVDFVDDVQVITIELPGVKKDDIDLQVTSNTTILLSFVKNGKDCWQEIEPEDCENYSLDSCVAKLDLGVLTLQLQKKMNKKHIEVQ